LFFFFFLDYYWQIAKTKTEIEYFLYCGNIEDIMLGCWGDWQCNCALSSILFDFPVIICSLEKIRANLKAYLM